MYLYVIAASVGISPDRIVQAEQDARMRAEREGGVATTHATWTPEINVGTAVLIPEEYVRDLDVRMGLYRRIAALEDREEIENLRVELDDRFGEPPVEVENLLEIIGIKALCRTAGIAKLDAGTGGAIVTFRDDTFVNPGGLVDWIASQAGTVKLRPDMRMVATRNWAKVDARLSGARDLAQALASIAASASAQAAQ